MSQTHKIKHYYTPQAFLMSSLLEVTVVYTTLSYKQLNSLTKLFEDGKHKEYTIRVCEEAIDSIEGLSGIELAVNQLPYSVLEELAGEIIKSSSITDEEFNKMTTSINIHFSDALSADTWKCEVCKRKRLQGSRNCGFLGEQDKDPTFKIVVDDAIYTHCPIYDLDKDILQKAIESYNVYKSGFLPDSGGWYDQTQFFCISSVAVNNAVEQRKAREQEKMLKQK